MARMLLAVLGFLYLATVAGAELTCKPLYSFDRGSDGWYVLEADGSKNYDLWKPNAGVDGSGALVLPAGVDIIFLDAPLNLPAEDICFVGKTSKASSEPIATIWWLQHGQSVACLAEGCYLTHFPPRAAIADLSAGFELYHFPRAMIQGPQCDQPETSAIAVTHENPFVIDNLGVFIPPDLKITKRCESLKGGVNRLFECTLEVTNVGRGPAVSIFVEDNLPEGLTFLPTGLEDGCTLHDRNRTARCTWTDLKFEPGSVVTLKLSMRADTLPKPQNCARVATPGDSNPGNDRACDAAQDSEPVRVFTDRKSWEAAVGEFTCAAFEDELLPPSGVSPTPFKTVDGILLESISSPDEVDIQYLKPGSINGSGELHFRDFTRGVRISDSSEYLAFGFDYFTGRELWTLAVLGVSRALPSFSNGFIGFVLDVSAPSFQLTGDVGAQGGISIDNLCRAVRDPGNTECCESDPYLIFCDCFESGDTSGWSLVVP